MAKSADYDTTRRWSQKKRQALKYRQNTAQARVALKSCLPARGCAPGASNAPHAHYTAQKPYLRHPPLTAIARNQVRPRLISPCTASSSLDSPGARCQRSHLTTYFRVQNVFAEGPKPGLRDPPPKMWPAVDSTACLYGFTGDMPYSQDCQSAVLDDHPPAAACLPAQLQLKTRSASAAQPTTARPQAH